MSFFGSLKYRVFHLRGKCVEQLEFFTFENNISFNIVGAAERTGHRAVQFVINGERIII